MEDKAYYLNISKLFGKYDYSLIFKDKMSILIGENGCGKSTVLRILLYLSTGDFLKLMNIDFEKISFKVNETLIEIDHNNFDNGNNDNRYYPELIGFIKKLNFNRINSYDEFINILKDPVNKKLIKRIWFNEDLSINDNKLIDNDIAFVNNDNFEHIIKKYSLKYCSKAYLKALYSYFKEEPYLLQIDEIFNKVKFYSFIDKDVEGITLDENIDTSAYISLLETYLVDKTFKFENGSLVIHDKYTNDLISLNKLSSGEYKVCHLLYLLICSKEDDILLLDEPDLSLSIFWQGKLAYDLKTICKAKKIIIATQSSDLIGESLLNNIIPLYVPIKDDYLDEQEDNYYDDIPF